LLIQDKLINPHDDFDYNQSKQTIPFEGFHCILYARIIKIHRKHGWAYLAYRKRGNVAKQTDAERINWWNCKLHGQKTVDGVVIMYRLIFRVMDDTGSASLLLFDDLLMYLFVSNAQHDTKYMYELGEGNMTSQYWFMTPPKAGHDVPYVFSQAYWFIEKSSTDDPWIYVAGNHELDLAPEIVRATQLHTSKFALV
nr:replication protein A 70 kDa DNA-binding subunit B [Tanacetum cinerariifolium]